LCGMEQARRSALAHHVHRTAPMGPRVLINRIWYKTFLLKDMRFLHRSLSGQMSVGVQKRPDGVNRDPNGGRVVGPRRSGL
jgi:hypothetical protein